MLLKKMDIFEDCFAIPRESLYSPARGNKNVSIGPVLSVHIRLFSGHGLLFVSNNGKLGPRLWFWQVNCRDMNKAFEAWEQRALRPKGARAD